MNKTKTSHTAAVLRFDRPADYSPAAGVALATAASLTLWLTLAEAAKLAMHSFF